MTQVWQSLIITWVHVRIINVDKHFRDWKVFKMTTSLLFAIHSLPSFNFLWINLNELRLEKNTLVLAQDTNALCAWETVLGIFNIRKKTENGQKQSKIIKNVLRSFRKTFIFKIEPYHLETVAKLGKVANSYSRKIQKISNYF